MPGSLLVLSHNINHEVPIDGIGQVEVNNARHDEDIVSFYLLNLRSFGKKEPLNN